LNKIRLIHWNSAEAKHLAGKLKEIGYSVVYEMPSGPDLLRELGTTPPAAVVIDLSRLPSQGRDMALAIRHQKATRYLPLVFVEGDAEKIARIKEHLPDAVYTTWSTIEKSLKRAIAHPPKDPVVPQSRMDGYSGAPLVKKFGIRANSVIVLVDAPKGFEKSLVELPEGVTLCWKKKNTRDLTIWFTRSANDLKTDIKKIVKDVEKGGLWIVWPKQASSMTTDLTQNQVRRIGLAAGLVDYKICSIDATWSGLLFTRRKSK
jgi:CheY-like chemotaxis protein